MLLSSASLHAQPLVIAHRGASGYLPEHTLQAKVLAYAQGADFVEQDVVMTRDDALIVFHDLTLDRTTDVATRFPGRAREDGMHYVIDFSLEEIRQLHVSEALMESADGEVPVYPERFPAGASRFVIHTLAEEIELVQGLNKVMDKNTGIYPEIKSPWFHHQHGKDLASAILDVLQHYGYDSVDDAVYLQCFDGNEVIRVREQLLPARNMNLKLVQLIADNSWLETFTLNNDGSLSDYNYNWMLTAEGLQELATRVDGIGPSMDMIVLPGSEKGHLQLSSLVDDAHAAGLEVHPFTFRRDANRLPGYVESFDELLELFLNDIGVDGVFTDFPDLVVQFNAKEGL